MNERVLCVLNPASECLLEGAAQVRMPSLRIGHRRQSGTVDTDRAVVDDSIHSANPTVVIIDVQRGIARPQLCGYTTIVKSSRKAGVEHLPPIFGGEPVDHFNPAAREAGVNPKPAGVR